MLPPIILRLEEITNFIQDQGNSPLTAGLATQVEQVAHDLAALRMLVNPAFISSPTTEALEDVESSLNLLLDALKLAIASTASGQLTTAHEATLASFRRIFSTKLQPSDSMSPHKLGDLIPHSSLKLDLDLWRSVGKEWAETALGDAPSIERIELAIQQLLALLKLTSHDQLAQLPVYKSLLARWSGFTLLQMPSLEGWLSSGLERSYVSYAFYETQLSSSTELMEMLSGTRLIPWFEYLLYPLRIRQSWGKRTAELILDSEPLKAAMNIIKSKRDYSRLKALRDASQNSNTQSFEDSKGLQRWVELQGVEMAHTLWQAIERGDFPDLPSSTCNPLLIRRTFTYINAIVGICRTCGVDWDMSSFQWPTITVEFRGLVEGEDQRDLEFIALPTHGSPFADPSDLQTLETIKGTSDIIACIGLGDIDFTATQPLIEDLLSTLRAFDLNVLDVVVVAGSWEGLGREQAIQAVQIATSAMYPDISSVFGVSPTRSAAEYLKRLMDQEDLPDGYQTWAQEGTEEHYCLAMLCGYNDTKIQQLVADPQALKSQLEEQLEDEDSDAAILRDRVLGKWYSGAQARMLRSKIVQVRDTLAWMALPVVYCATVAGTSDANTPAKVEELLPWLFNLTSDIQSARASVLNDVKNSTDPIIAPKEREAISEAVRAAEKQIREWNSVDTVDGFHYSLYVPDRIPGSDGITLPLVDIETFLVSLRMKQVPKIKTHLQDLAIVYHALFLRSFQSGFSDITERITKLSGGKDLVNSHARAAKYKEEVVTRPLWFERSDLRALVNIKNTKYTRQRAIDRLTTTLTFGQPKRRFRAIKHTIATLLVSITLPLWKLFDDKIDYQISPEMMHQFLTSQISGWFEEFREAAQESVCTIMDAFIEQADVTIAKALEAEQRAFPQESDILHKLPLHIKEYLDRYANSLTAVLGALDVLLQFME